MKNRLSLTPLSVALLAFPVAASLALLPAISAAQYYPPPPYQGQAEFSQQELDQMLAPIALYPDSLLSQILMAATYPLEVVQAARWSAAFPSLQGDAAVRAVEQQDWDPSVKSLVAFPQILAMMDAKLDWTERLGDAFLAQEPQVMDTVQNLRQRAYAAGNLRSDDQIRVITQGPAIVVEPVYPEIVYVPYYDPLVVYGRWWWAAPPVYWAPWRGYHAPRPGFYFSWGVGIRVGNGFFFGAFDWPRRETRVVTVNNYYYNRAVIVNRRVEAHNNTVVHAPGVWRHDPGHRRGDPYRNPGVRARFAAENAPRIQREARPNDNDRSVPQFRGRTEERRGEAVQRSEIRQEPQRIENRNNDNRRSEAAPRIEPRSEVVPQNNKRAENIPNRGVTGPQAAPPSLRNDDNRRGEPRRDSPPVTRVERPVSQVRSEGARPAPAAQPQQAEIARSATPDQTARSPRSRELRPSDDAGQRRGDGAGGDGGERREHKDRRG